jgi:hypothetical protein
MHLLRASMGVELRSVDLYNAPDCVTYVKQRLESLFGPSVEASSAPTVV